MVKFYAILILIFNFILLYSQDTQNIIVEEAKSEKIYITLDDALNLAFDNDKTLKQAEYDVKIAQTQKKASFSDIFMPSLNINGGLNISQPKEYSINDVNTGVYTSADTWSLNANLSKVFFTGFRNLNTDKARSINLKMKKEIYYDAKKDVELNTKLNFYNTFVAYENYRVYLQQQLN